jgi:hypothetical protein
LTHFEPHNGLTRSWPLVEFNNVSLHFVNLHLYDVFGPKQATIVNFDALFENIGFGAIFFVFDRFGNCWNEGEEIHILLI